MASGKRASMREGPLAALFRKTEEEGLQGEGAPPQQAKPEQPREPEAQATRQREEFRSPTGGAHESPRAPEPELRPAPPSLGLLTINALTAADKVIVPVQCEYLSMRGLIQLQNTLSMIRENLNPDVQIEGILPTLVDTRTVHAKEAIELLEENFGDRVFASRITKTVRFAEAPVKGMSVLKYDPDGKAAYAYRQLAKEVLSNGKR